MFREAKQKMVSKESLVRGLKAALRKKITQASDDLFEHIKTFTDDREDHHERIQALIRAKLLRNGQKSADMFIASMLEPISYDEKNAIEYVLGPVGIENNDYTMEGVDTTA